MVHMNNQNRPEMITLDDQNFGSHVEHWNLLTQEPNTQVPKWLGLALDAPIMPMGLCPSEQHMDPEHWLIQGPKQSFIQFSQVIEVENQHPRSLKIAFPHFQSPYKVKAKIERIIRCSSNTQAVLQLNLGQNNIVYAFDTLYSVNHNQYSHDQTYLAQLNAWAYELQAVADDEQLVVDDPASIRHHHALNDILRANKGIAPENLQEKIEAWQPSSDDDQTPVTVNFSKMVAYLYGENMGQEDEAWFQGRIVGKTQVDCLDDTYTLYDVVFIHEEDQEAILIRIATQNPAYQNFDIGQYIRGNLWIQVSIYSQDAA